MQTFAQLLSQVRGRTHCTIDQRCIGLAQHFLPNGSEREVHDLAWQIQSTVEDHLWEPDEQ